MTTQTIRVIAWDREGTDEPCERGTVGCSIDHTGEWSQLREDARPKSESRCETW